jgi:FtsP/CotA-like multicopper oxidase with cupredoxin domain
MTMDHPFHVHVFPFQVIDRDGEPEAYRTWRDTVNVRPGEEVRIAVPFERFTGVTMMHCHIVEHEDLGMMALFAVE